MLILPTQTRAACQILQQQYNHSHRPVTPSPLSSSPLRACPSISPTLSPKQIPSPPQSSPPSFARALAPQDTNIIFRPRDQQKAREHRDSGDSEDPSWARSQARQQYPSQHVDTMSLPTPGEIAVPSSLRPQTQAEKRHTTTVLQSHESPNVFRPRQASVPFSARPFKAMPTFVGSETSLPRQTRNTSSSIKSTPEGAHTHSKVASAGPADGHCGRQPARTGRRAASGAGSGNEARDARRKLFLDRVRRESGDARWTKRFEGRGGEEEMLRAMWIGEERRRREMLEREASLGTADVMDDLEGTRSSHDPLYVDDLRSDGIEESWILEEERLASEEMAWRTKMENSLGQSPQATDLSGTKDSSEGMNGDADGEGFGSDEEEYDQLFMEVLTLHGGPLGAMSAARSLGDRDTAVDNDDMDLS